MNLSIHRTVVLEECISQHTRQLCELLTFLCQREIERREAERQQRELDRQRELQRQRDVERQRELERERLREREKLKQLERERERERERIRELERQRRQQEEVDIDTFHVTSNILELICIVL